MIARIRKQNKEHTIVFSMIITVLTLMISSLFNWDAMPITGLDKLTGDILVTLFCLLVIYMLGIEKTAGFRRKGFIKGFVCGTPFIVIGIGAAVIGNAGLNVMQLQPIPLWGILMFTINMLFVGVNEEILMRSLILNNFILKYGEDKQGLYKSIFLSSLIFGVIHLVNIFFMPPVLIAIFLIHQDQRNRM